jgi:hypothetical protein
MNISLNSKFIGQFLTAIGIISLLDFVFLIIFFIGYFNGIPSIFFFGPLNDLFTAFMVILTVVLATTVLALPGLSWRWLYSIGVGSSWIGAFIVAFNSLMAGNIISNNTATVLGNKYEFISFLITHDMQFGFGLIGVWLIILNFQAMRIKSWPNHLIGLGFLTGLIMTFGLAGKLPLWFVILYPIWCILLGRWIFSRQNEKI